MRLTRVDPMVECHSSTGQDGNPSRSSGFFPAITVRNIIGLRYIFPDIICSKLLNTTNDWFMTMNMMGLTWW